MRQAEKTQKSARSPSHWPSVLGQAILFDMLARGLQVASH